HHAGIEEEYKALAAANKNFTFVFDNSKSGASLSWSYFFPEEPMPELVKYVEDADLWKWTYGQKSKDANNFLFMLENKPEEMLALFDKPTDSVLGNGSLISRYIGITLDQDLREVEPINIAVGDRVVPFYNITHNKSDAGNSLSKLRDKTVGLFTIKGPTITISFRCLDKHVPSALDLAKALGGGGHRNASGASMRLEDFIRAIRK
ncbi:MAG TPA: DHHA1 domain-containing protein, partial [Candidatus Paceibacterota bacterium]|nr:DHHA1 domain-containing protein [Candidatus Paceibacterota bacterium]